MKPTLIPAASSLENLKSIRKECQTLVKQSSFISAGVAIIPIPFIDMLIDAGILSQLLPEISKRFGLNEGRTSIYSPATKEIHWDAVKSLGVEMAGLVATRTVVKKTMQGFGSRVVTKQVSKFIPFGGQVVAASIGFFVMRKIAQAHLDECYQQAVAASQHAA